MLFERWRNYFAYLEDLGVLLGVVGKQGGELVDGLAEDLLGLLLEAGHPHVLGGVGDAEAEHHAPVELLVLHVALLAAEEAVVLVQHLDRGEKEV